MITTTRMQNEKQRLSAEAAERFSTRNATAFLTEITQKWKELRLLKTLLQTLTELTVS